tara:strand:- start:3840 stop:4070 length:231 start_codon:yes stop_codon:yes gene_type:complete
MKIISKEIKEDGSEFIIYLADNKGNPLKADIVTEEDKNDTINNLLAEYFTPEDWVNNKEDISTNVVEVNYKEYITQ